MVGRYKIPDLYDATIGELLEGLNEGHFTVVQLVSAYIARIGEVNTAGPQLRAVLEVNAAALEQAARRDEERATVPGSSMGNLGPLHGIPILVKDNIGTVSPVGSEEKMGTSAGSFALRGCYPVEDATVVRKLREAGAIILGKTNMSEWAHWRGSLPSGWSSVGGQCLNPYYPGADPSGSSSGSAVAASIGLAAAALGTETDGSISCPSSFCNVVGIKPTVGLTSRTGVIPISKTQDSIGPMCRTVADVAHILQAINGPDERDRSSLDQPHGLCYLSALQPDFIRGKRIGVLRGLYVEKVEDNEQERITLPHRLAAFEGALGHLRRLGAELVDPVEIETARLILGQREKEVRVLKTEFKVGFNEYLPGIREHPTGVHTLEDVIQFNRTHPETHFKGEENQDILVQSNESQVDDAYHEAVLFGHSKSREEGIDACLKRHNLDLLIAPWSDQASFVSAVAGYPMLTMPLGFLPDSVQPHSRAEGFPFSTAPGLPFGIVLMGGEWSERMLLGSAYSLEQSMKARWQRRAFADAIPKSQLPGFATLANDKELTSGSPAVSPECKTGLLSMRRTMRNLRSYMSGFLHTVPFLLTRLTR